MIGCAHSPAQQVTVERDSYSGATVSDRRCTTATAEPRRPFGRWTAPPALQP